LAGEFYGDIHRFANKTPKGQVVDCRVTTKLSGKQTAGMTRLWTSSKFYGIFA